MYIWNEKHTFMKTRYVENLGEVMKDQKAFLALPTEMKKAVYSFLTANRKIRVRKKRLDTLIKEHKEAIKALNKELKNLSIAETENYNIIKHLPKGTSLSNVYVESDKGKYIRLDIQWCGIRKKCSLGKDLSEINKICKDLNPKFNQKISLSNYKNIVNTSFAIKLNDFLVENGYESFRDSKRLKWNRENSEFQYEFSKDKDDIINRPIKHKKTERTTLKSKKGIRKDYYGKLNKA
jgi:hypothetical protein